MAFTYIPLDNSPNQTFKITVLVDGKNLTLSINLNYNEDAGYWVMTITDIYGNILLASIPVLMGETVGTDNILYQYGYLQIGSAYILNVSNSPKDYPDDTDLGTDFVLLWGDTVDYTVPPSNLLFEYPAPEPI
jgi:hypothetical protein